MVYQHYRSNGLELPNLRVAAEKVRQRFPLDVLTAFRAPMKTGKKSRLSKGCNHWLSSGALKQSNPNYRPMRSGYTRVNPCSRPSIRQPQRKW
jgi:hypothetical protein